LFFSSRRKYSARLAASPGRVAATMLQFFTLMYYTQC
jgi:hypothetical protein